jgi:hypothetical protein
MNSRERLLGIVVGCLAIIIGGFFIQRWVSGKFATRYAEMERLTGDLKKFKRQVQLSQAARRKIANYAERSLPADPEVARTRYQNWLVSEMEFAELLVPDVRLQSTQVEKDLFTRQTFAAEAVGTLPQAVELLHSFYSVDWLHRITQLKLRPVKDSKLLNITLHIEALSMLKSVATEKLPDRPSHRLELADRNAYYARIVGRNLFGPRNQPPKLTVSGSQDVYLGRDVDLSIKWEDPDWLDNVYMNLVEAPKDAKLNQENGQLTWKPTEPGTYEFLIEGIDDGFPALHSSQEKIVINVKEQPKPPAGPPAFDPAKFTILTSVLHYEGQGEVWLHVRPTGQMVILHQGDQFEVGSVKGTVAEINEEDFAFDFEGKRRKLGKGELLDQAKLTGEISQVATPAKPAAAEVEVKTKAVDEAS